MHEIIFFNLVYNIFTDPFILEHLHKRYKARPRNFASAAPATKLAVRICVISLFALIKNEATFHMSIPTVPAHRLLCSRL